MRIVVMIVLALCACEKPAVPAVLTDALVEQYIKALSDTVDNPYEVVCKGGQRTQRYLTLPDERRRDVIDVWTKKHGFKGLHHHGDVKAAIVTAREILEKRRSDPSYQPSPPMPDADIATVAKHLDRIRAATDAESARWPSCNY